MSQNTTAMQRGAGGETTGATDMTTQQPEALRLANVCSNLTRYSMDAHLIAAELCRQHARITELESQLAQRFDAADMATAAAQGFRVGATAPAQPVAEPAPSATAHVGDSLFESWFSEYNPALRGTKQLMRDAYAAGMGDPKAQPSTTPHGQVPVVHGDALSDAVHVPLNSLHADAAYLIGRLREGSMPYARVIGIIRERIDAAKAAIRARASHGQAPAQPDPAYSEACNLATALFKKHFAHLPDYASGQVVWGLFDSTEGVILQIDNMVSGLVQPPTTSPQADSVQEDALDAAFEAVRKRLCGVQRYSFVLDDDGLVRRVLDRAGNWIEFDEAHTLLDPMAVDAARKQGANHDNA